VSENRSSYLNKKYLLAIRHNLPTIIVRFASCDNLKRKMLLIVHECVAFILIDAGKVLLEQRALHDGSGTGLLNIPGGHIETGENQVRALARELNEEINVKLESHQFLCSLYYPATELQLIHYYVVTKWSGVIQALEAEAVYWHEIADAPLKGDTDKIALSEYIRLSNYGAIRL